MKREAPSMLAIVTRRVPQYLLCVGYLFGFAAVQPLHSQQLDSTGVSRLAALGRVWAAVRFQHPWTETRHPGDVDSAAVVAIGMLERSDLNAPYERAIKDLVSVLGDPVTRVLPRSDDLPDRWIGAGRSPSLATLTDSTLLISIHRYSDLSGAGELPDTEKRIAAMDAALEVARAVIVDVRTDQILARTPDDIYWFRNLIEAVLRRLTTRTVVPPAMREVIRTGVPEEWLPDRHTSAPGGGFLQVSFVTPISPARGARAVPVVIVANELSELPAYASALHREGVVALVTEGSIGAAPFIRYRDVDAGEGVIVRVRLSEMADPEGRGVPPATVVAARGRTGSEDEALDHALQLIRANGLSPTPGAALPSLMIRRPVSVTDEPLPSREHRLFALLKLWASIETFYPSGRPASWYGVLDEFVPRMREADSVLDYHLALAELMNRLDDSHASLSTPALEDWRGRAFLPIGVDFVEGQIVVTNVAGDSLLRGDLISAGDVVLTIDGEDALVRGRRIARTFSHSTQARADVRAAHVVRRGPAGSEATLTIRDATGNVRRVTLPRYTGPVLAADFAGRGPAAVRLVGPGIGYIDISRVPGDSADVAFARLQGTAALILDWRRGSGTTFPFVSRLLNRDSVPQHSTRPYVGHLGGSWWSDERGRIETTNPCAGCKSPTHYPGFAVLLIGPLPQSSMEVNAALLREANGTPFIGTPTSGTLGGTSALYVPGGIRLVFTSGAGPNRTGLQPDVRVQATIAGIREGRDEVLDAAIAYIQARIAR
jgi:C-terminal processing protease CtpA/Prc